MRFFLRDDAKLQRASALGADHVINGATQDIAAEVMKLTGGRGVDVVIENVGQAVWSSALKSLVRDGCIVTCGATTGDQPPADLRRIFIRQLSIFGSTLGDLDGFRDLLGFVQRTGLRPEIYCRYQLDNVHAALDQIGSRQSIREHRYHTRRILTSDRYESFLVKEKK